LKNFFYLSGIRTATIQFLDIFNDIKIAKFEDDASTIIKMVDVPLKLMPKQKYYEWVHDRKLEKRFPMMGAELIDMTYAQERMSGKYAKVSIDVGDETTTYFDNGIPYDLQFELHVTTEYMTEMYQIAEQILPFFVPSVETIGKIKGSDLSWDIKVNSEGVTMDHPSDIDSSALREIHWTFNFKVETLLFKGNANVNKTIRKVVEKYYLSDDSWDARNTTTDMPSGVGSQQFETLIIGWKEDEEIMTRYERY